MMSTEQALTGQVISKVWNDEAFKERLLTDPKAAIRDEFGIEFNDSIEVNAMTETPGKLYLVIPPNPTELKVKSPNEVPMWV